MEDYFDVIKTGASSGPVKDRRIEEVIAEFSLDREEVLYVGDAPSDVKACRDCNIRIAELPQMRPDFLFSSVAGFSEFLREKLE
jgi:phosphoglycolate phosphatase/pyrophosphatase PpaX